jgi:uncharacterized protein CbrC (UPF0167 family)
MVTHLYDAQVFSFLVVVMFLSFVNSFVKIGVGCDQYVPEEMIMALVETQVLFRLSIQLSWTHSCDDIVLVNEISIGSLSSISKMVTE